MAYDFDFAVAAGVFAARADAPSGSASPVGAAIVQTQGDGR